jgi:hypothetical protein
MLRLRRLALAIVLLLTGVSLTRSGWAADDTDPVRIEYQTEGSCPSKASFVAEVKARLAQRSTPHGPDARLFTVTIRPSGAGSEGQLQIRQHSGAVDSQSIKGASCAEVGSALALVTALAIAGDPVLPSASFPELVPSSPAHKNLVLPAPTPTLRRSVRRPSQPIPELLDPSPPGIDWKWSAGASGVVLLSITPVPAYGGAAFVNAAPSGSWIIRPEFRLAAVYVVTPTWAETGARWRWWVARAEACPVRIGREASELYLNLCGAFEAGPTGTDRPVAETHAWLALGPEARLAWQHPRGLLLELGAGVRVPLVRWTYSFSAPPLRSGRVVHATPAYGPTFTLGVGYTWQ